MEGHTPSQNDILYATCLAVLIIVTLCGNVLICVAFMLYDKLRTITNYFVISLAVSDLLVAIIPMPLWLYYTVERKWPTWMKDDMFALIDILTCVSSIGNLTAISIDRYFSVVTPLKRDVFMTKPRALLSIIFVWICSVTIAATNQVLPFQDYTYFVSTIGILIPLIITICAYIGMFCAVRKFYNGSMDGGLAQEWRLARTILVVIAVFIICWAPFLILNLYFVLTLNPPSLLFINAFKWLHYFNSCCNPIIYAICHQQIKKALKRMFCRHYTLHNESENIVLNTIVRPSIDEEGFHNESETNLLH